MRKRLLAAVVLAGLGSAAYGQFGMSPIKRPNIANVFRPVVSQGAVYEETGEDGKKRKSEMYVVGKEMVGTEEAYWVEIGHSADAEGNLSYAKLLVTKDFAPRKMVFVLPGSTQPMEMDMEKSGESALAKEVDKWRLVGNETVTVPAGTFACEHWQREDGKGDAWVSPKVSPMSMVKSVENGRTKELTKLLTDAKSRIVGTPVKFDPRKMKAHERP